MPDYCNIPGCGSNADNKPGCSFYSFPTNKFSFDKWMDNITNYSRSYKYKNYHRVCQLHFRGGKKTLNERIPTLFPNPQTASQPFEKGLNSSIRSNDLECNTSHLDESFLLSKPDETSFDTEESMNNPFQNRPNSVHNTDELKTNSSQLMISFLTSNTDSEANMDTTGPSLTDDHNYSFEKEYLNYLKGVIANKVEIIEKLNEDVENYKKIIKTLNNSNMLKQELDKRQKCKKSKTNSNKSKVEELYEDIINDEKKLNYYTGFSSLTLYNDLYEYIENDFPHIKLYNMKQSDSPKIERYTSLSMSVQFILVLMRLRVNIDGQDLAYRFGVSESTISRYWITWVNFLYIRLRQIPIWPTVEIIYNYRPSVFKVKGYETVDGILDFTEMFIQTSSSYRIQSETYSNYKHHNPVKGLVACAPNGFFIFASDLATGSLSDKVLTLESGILDKFTPGRSIMPDRGFLIEDECEKRNIKLNIPPFMNGRSQFSVEDENIDIANLRIHIERIINRVKCYRIFSGVFPNSMHTELNPVWHRLVNWINKPLLD